MRTRILTIHWQRLLDNGKTCPRCAETEQELLQTVERLRQALKPLNVEVRWEQKEITPEDFLRAPLRSNSIHINGRLLEDWLGASTGHSPCCDVCGPNDCRTIIVGESEYEEIPSALIIRAALLAAAELFDETPHSPA